MAQQVPRPNLSESVEDCAGFQHPRADEIGDIDPGRGRSAK
jgi:hypothetical protein